MKPIFKSSLIKDVVISYVCMIVFPVMIILGMVFLLAGRYIYRAATESVTVTQQAVLELYKEETRGSALALSRVVNMNGGTTIQDASGYDTQRQEQAMEQLYTMYQMLAAPEYKILDIHIYRKDGTAIIPKGEMRYSVEELRQKEWYQTALRQPGLVHTSLVEEDYFYRIRSSQEILEISAYAPRRIRKLNALSCTGFRRYRMPLKTITKTEGWEPSVSSTAREALWLTPARRPGFRLLSPKKSVKPQQTWLPQASRQPAILLLQLTILPPAPSSRFHTAAYAI